MKKIIIKNGEYYYIMVQDEGGSRFWNFLYEVQFKSLDEAESFYEAHLFRFSGEYGDKVEKVKDL